MNFNPAAGRANPFAALRRYTRPQSTQAQERCELCSTVLPPTHRHLLEEATRKIICACDACALRFQAVEAGRFKLIPRDVRTLPEFQLTDAQWENLALPINLAFVFYSTPHQKITAMYPSPAGATESLLPLTAWEELVANNDALAHLEPDVEALLINRVGTTRQNYLAPIDTCFELVGLIRMHWRGLSGGEEVWRHIEAFFARLDAQSAPAAPTREASHA